MANPQVYAGPGVTKIDDVTKQINSSSPNVLSGPNWIPTLTGNLDASKAQAGLKRSNSSKTWYCLDLLGKYHKESKLKQFHALTFYFRNTKQQNGAIITSMLPESFTYAIGGVYNNPIKLIGNDIVNVIAQNFTNGNASTSFNLDTALVWQSPKRMDLVFKIPVFDDSASGSNINYQEAIDLFGEAILPEIAKNGTYESIPGPNISTTIRYRARNGKAITMSGWGQKITDVTSKGFQTVFNGQEREWDRISVQVGGLLLLDWCVIKDLKVTFPNTKAMVLHDFRGTHSAQIDDTGRETYQVHLQPIQAELEVTVSTVMGITRATFKDMLYQTESTSKGYKEDASNTTPVTSTYKQTIDTLNNIALSQRGGYPQMSYAPGYNEHDFDLFRDPSKFMSYPDA